MKVLEVIRPGPLTTVQDLGRYGYQKFGVPVSGVMDSYAFRMANLLLDNPHNSAVLEITFIGLVVKFLVAPAIAITGADLSPKLNGKPLTMWQSVSVKKGDMVSFTALRSGLRSYLSVKGGIDVPLVMGSRSTYIRSHIGGFKGRALIRGDCLNDTLIQPGSLETTKKIPANFIPHYNSTITLRVIMGTEENNFTEDDINTFFTSEYTVSPQSDRTGYRLKGKPVKHRNGADIISDGIPPGAVQIPGDEMPILLLADHQTTGGYAKIATIISVDLSKIAQSKPGDKIHFRKISIGDAQELLLKQEQLISSLAKRLKGIN